VLCNSSVYFFTVFGFLFCRDIEEGGAWLSTWCCPFCIQQDRLFGSAQLMDQPEQQMDQPQLTPTLDPQ
jgi:hypothetical protein